MSRFKNFYFFCLLVLLSVNLIYQIKISAELKQNNTLASKLITSVNDINRQIASHSNSPNALSKIESSVIQPPSSQGELQAINQNINQIRLDQKNIRQEISNLGKNSDNSISYSNAGHYAGQTEYSNNPRTTNESAALNENNVDAYNSALTLLSSMQSGDMATMQQLGNLRTYTPYLTEEQLVALRNRISESIKNGEIAPKDVPMYSLF